MSGARAWPPVLALLVLAPVSAEMSWGGIPYTEVLVVVAFLAPLYGGAPYDEEISAGEELFHDSVAAVICLAVVGLCLWRHRRVAHAQEAP